MTPVTPPEVRSLVLFGSRARGDSDLASDTDICAITENVSFGQIAKIQRALSRVLNVDPASVVVFTHSTIEAMADNGALFAHHLKDEGVILEDRLQYFEKLKSRVRPFTGYNGEVRIYRELLSDASTNNRGGDLSEFDLHILQLIVRNLSILLTHRAGSVEFSREGAYHAAAKLYGELPVDASLFRELTDWHLTYERGAAGHSSLPSRDRAKEIISRVGAMIDFTEHAIQ